MSSLKSRTNARTPRVRTTVFTKARNALIRRDYPAGVDLFVMLDRLNALGGPPIMEASCIAPQAWKLGVDRQGEIVEPDPGEAIDATLDDVALWAGRRGIRFASWDDLPAVNHRRFLLGWPEFKRSFAVKYRISL